MIRIIFIFLLLLTAALPVGAEPNYRNAEKSAIQDAEAVAMPERGSFTVTSIEKCYAQLSPADVIDIKKNSIKPYQECQRRLALKVKEKQTLTVTPPKDPKEQAAVPPAETDAETTRQYYRVQKTPFPPPSGTLEKAKPSDNTRPPN